MIADYVLKQLLGAGGMGAVYLARQTRLNRDVALKVLHDGFAADPKARAAFDREAELISRLEHPNIVAVYDRNGPADAHLWLSMRHIAGGDGDALLADEADGLAPERAVRLIGDIAQALDYAHGRGVLHRDVKPANILIENRFQDNERAVLTDFGIARALGATLTMTGVAATLAYAAPERFIAGQVLDQRADVYSLGCTLFRFLTGQVPYPAGDPAAVVAAHMYVPPPSLHQLHAHLPPFLDTVIATALAKNPNDRYPTCAALVTDAWRAITATTRHRAATDPEKPEVRADPAQEVDVFGIGRVFDDFFANLLADEGKAEALYRYHADEGNTTVINNLGVLLEKRGDRDGAETWYRRAANEGNTDGMVNLGALLEKRGDRGEAETWYRRAADKGNADAMIHLGNLLKKRRR